MLACRMDAVRLLAGDRTTAQALASHQNIAAVTLTGSLAAGYAMQEICARRMVPLQAELNGNNAAIVWDDADRSHAAKQMAWGAFGFAGQRCTANRRVIVSRKQFPALLEELKTAAEELVWGDPLDPATDIGPVISIAKRDETAGVSGPGAAGQDVHAVEMLQRHALQEPWVNAGAYAQPAILCCDQPDHPLVQEETMSPLLVVQRADDFEHALALCNGTRYGLAAALFSNDARTPSKIPRRGAGRHPQDQYVHRRRRYRAAIWRLESLWIRSARAWGGGPPVLHAHASGLRDAAVNKSCPGTSFQAGIMWRALSHSLRQ